ncbi:MAG TPA: hypothetical protein VGY91_07485 [Chthoniobacterales bacterium]|nr:hypothetical protein [Chthoniobacterales bacterium]
MRTFYRDSVNSVGTAQLGLKELAIGADNPGIHCAPPMKLFSMEVDAFMIYKYHPMDTTFAIYKVTLQQEKRIKLWNL